MYIKKIYYYYKDTNNAWSMKIVVLCEGLSAKANEYLTNKINNQKDQNNHNTKLLTAEVGDDYKNILGFNQIKNINQIFESKIKVDFSGTMSVISGGDVKDVKGGDSKGGDSKGGDSKGGDDNDDGADPPERNIEDGDGGEDDNDADTEDVYENADLKTESGTKQDIKLLDIKYESEDTLGITFLKGMDSPLYFICNAGIFEEDTIMDFKKKINYLFKVPLFRQHLYVYNNMFKTYPLLYTIKEFYKLNINNDYSIVENKFKIPDLDSLNVRIKYNIYNTITYDSFSLVNKYHTMYLIDMNDIIDSDVKTKLKQNELLFKRYYYSFICKYFPITSEEIFNIFITKGSITSAYPSIDPDSMIQGYLSNQIDISREANLIATEDIKDIKLTVSIEKFSYKIASSFKETIIDMRVFFDKLDTNLFNTDIIRFNDIIDKKVVTYYKRNILKLTSQTNKDQVSISSIREPMVISLRIPLGDNNNYLFVDIYQNGTYVLSTKWINKKISTFEDNTQIITKHTLQVIASLEQVVSQCLYIKLQNNSKVFKDISTGYYLDLDISLVWYQDIISKDDNALFKSILKQLTEANIIHEKTIVSSKFRPNTYLYNIRKCMYEFDVMRFLKIVDNVNNFYSYLFVSALGNAWNYLFERSRTLEVLNTRDYVLFSINSIKTSEYLLFFKYILYIIRSYKTGMQKLSSKQQIVPSKKINNLKMQDPKLYTQKDTQTGKVYSRICQFKKQPVIVSDLSQLSEEEKKNTIKFWNYTKERPEHYRCPHSKFPFVNMITGKHPQGFCLPCCGINDPRVKGETSKTNKTDIYDDCIKQHIFTGKRLKNRDIERINKFKHNSQIATGRLTTLPYPINKIFVYNEIMLTAAENNKIFYIMGIPNKSPVIEILDLASISKQTICDQINKSPISKFYSLMEGKILQYFKTPLELSNYINKGDR
jgi:hypothetical protein